MRRLTALVLAALAMLPAGAARAQTTAPIRIATTPIDLGAEALYANDLGLFKKAGLDVELSILGNGAAVAAAVAGGSIDIGQANVGALASAHASGLPFAIVAPAGIYTTKAPTTELLVAESSPIRGAKQLDGKIVAVQALRDLNWVGIQSWLARGGADVATVKFTEIPGPATCTALTAGRADAGIVSEPYLTVALQNGCRSLAPTHDAIAKEFLIGAWFTTTAWGQAHAEEIRRFRAVIADTARWANAHHAESARILERYTKLSTPPGMRRVVFAERAEAGQIQPVIDAAARTGVLKSAFPASELLLP